MSFNKILFSTCLSACLMIAAPALADKEAFLQQGHAKLHEGKTDEAIALYKQALAEDPTYKPAKSSLENALQKQAVQEFTKTLPENCRTISKQLETNFDCAQQYFTVGGEPVNARVVQQMLTWISDKGNLVTSINLIAAQHSNQFFTGDTTTSITRSGTFFTVKLQEKPKTSDRTGPAWFSYTVQGKTQTGVFVITTAENDSGGGTYDNGRIIFVRLDKAATLTENGMVLDDVSLVKLNEFSGTASNIKITGNVVSWHNKNGEHSIDAE